MGSPSHQYYKEISEIKIIISFKYFESPHLRIRILQIGLKGVGFFLWNSHIAFPFKSERRLAEFFFSSGSTFIKDNEYYLGFCSVIFLTLLIECKYCLIVKKKPLNKKVSIFSFSLYFIDQLEHELKFFPYAGNAPFFLKRKFITIQLGKSFSFLFWFYASFEKTISILSIFNL